MLYFINLSTIRERIIIVFISIIIVVHVHRHRPIVLIMPILMLYNNTRMVITTNAQFGL